MDAAATRGNPHPKPKFSAVVKKSRAIKRGSEYAASVVIMGKTVRVLRRPLRYLTRCHSAVNCAYMGAGDSLRPWRQRGNEEQRQSGGRLSVPAARKNMPAGPVLH
jgi:hypothetical protein